MKPKFALILISILTLAGVLFAGYLSYSEIFMKKCLIGNCTVISGIPACVYGMIMFLIILIIAISGIKYQPKAKISYQK